MAQPAHSTPDPSPEDEIATLRALLASKDEELRERDMLVREVNHRVANSLQLASSMLRMQAYQEDDAHTREQLEKAGLRIGSIQHVHSRLYRSGDMRTIEFSQYLRDLCADLSSSILGEENHQKFQIDVECERMRLATDHVSKVGLVVNELVTNAFKHGHHGNKPCVITVRAHKTEDGLALDVSDTGPGLPGGFELGRVKGLGMRLVRFVAGSLGGELSARNGDKGGAVFSVLLPLPETSAPLPAAE